MTHTWPEVEQTLAKLSRPAMLTFAVRAARRALPAIAALKSLYGSEAWEWLNAAETTVRVSEAVARGEEVSPFTLTIASELARAVATATAAAARTHGPSMLIEKAEMAIAAAAFTADAARCGMAARTATLVLQAARASANGGAVPPEQIDDLDCLLAGEDPEALWPAGEPEGWVKLWEEFGQRTDRLPRLIDWS